MTTPATGPLSRIQRIALFVGAGFLLAFGVLVVWRSALMSRRMGDLDCFLRPAWAALSGVGLYDLTTENNWHYNYPPLYAILMVPLADPPLDHDRTGFVPYPVSVAIIYLLNVVCAVFAVHVLARALERHASDSTFLSQPRFCRRWWSLRLFPVSVCLLQVLHSAMRGQVNLQILALLSVWIACRMSRPKVWGGLSLAVAACIKVIPVYLFVDPLWRREGRTLAGCGIGLLIGLVIVPAAFFGPARAWDEYRRYGEVFFAPALGLEGDESRQHELLGVDSTDSMGIKHALHHWINPDPYHRPMNYHPAVTATYVILGVLMTLAVLWPARRSASVDSETTALVPGLLLMLMVFFGPTSHMHYFMFCIPLIMTLLWRRWQHQPTLKMGWPLAVTLLWFVLATWVPLIPDQYRLRDLRVPLLGALPLWIFGVVELWRSRLAAVGQPTATPARMAA